MHGSRHGCGHGPSRARAFGFGALGEWGGTYGPRGRGRKARRGDIRTAALLLIAEQPRNGYQIMQEVQQRSGGVWRASPGSVYPALAQLEDEGLIRSQERDGRKLYALTDDGRGAVERRGSERPAPWEEMSGEVSEPVRHVGRLLREVAMACAQVMRSGGESQLAHAGEVLANARRELYRILADGEGDGEGEG